jgi:hypothetical protein
MIAEGKKMSTYLAKSMKIRGANRYHQPCESGFEVKNISVTYSPMDDRSIACRWYLRMHRMQARWYLR